MRDAHSVEIWIKADEGMGMKVYCGEVPSGDLNGR